MQKNCEESNERLKKPQEAWRRGKRSKKPGVCCFGALRWTMTFLWGGQQTPGQARCSWMRYLLLYIATCCIIQLMMCARVV